MRRRTTAEVGALIKARRIELALTEARLRELAGIDPKTQGGMEDGSRWPQERTRMKVEPVLLWKPGSIEALRNGGDATELPANEVERPSPLRAATVDELLAEVRRRIVSPPSEADHVAAILSGSDEPPEAVQDERRFGK